MDAEQPQPTAGAARHLHGNPDAGRRYKPWMLLILAVGIGIGLFNGLLAWRDKGPSPIIDGVVELNEPNDAVVSGAVAYDMRPPAGGPHAALTQECGLYRVPVHDENAVASLATGAVWMAYDPALPDDKVEILRKFATGKLDVILSPYPDLPVGAGVVLTAWGRQLTLTPEQIPDPRIVRFIEMYSNGQQAPDPNADCRDGVGAP